MNRVPVEKVDVADTLRLPNNLSAISLRSPIAKHSCTAELRCPSSGVQKYSTRPTETALPYNVHCIGPDDTRILTFVRIRDRAGARTWKRLPPARGQILAHGILAGR